jgi:hypothetical protein
VSYQFTRLWAFVLAVTGSVVIAVGLVAAVAVGIVGPDVTRYLPGVDPLVARVVVTVVCAAAGFLVGAPLIVAGQVLEAFLDQRDILARIHRRLRRKRSRVAHDDRSHDDRSRLFPPRAVRR